jgi:hypothetical protein
MDVLQGVAINAVGMFSDRGRVCMFVIDGKDQHVQQSDDGMDNGKINSEEQQ